MIGTGRLCEFVNEFIKTHNDEEEDKSIWEFWLHKVDNQSWAEFRASVMANKPNGQAAAPTQNEIEDTVRASYEMLEGFSLCGGAQDGIIQAAGYDSD